MTRLPLRERPVVYTGALVFVAVLAVLVLRQAGVLQTLELSFYDRMVAWRAASVPAGDRDPSGRFPAGSVFGRVERRIIEIAERLREAEGHPRIPQPPGSMDDVSHADLSEAGDYRSK